MTRPAAPALLAPAICSLALCALALCALAEDALAAPDAQPPPKSPEQQAADRHFKSGVARFKEGKFTEALAEFERANQISPHPLVLYNIAGCYRELSRYSEAVRFYRRFLAEGVGKVPPNRLADAQAELEGIFALVARVTVQVEPVQGASLTIDGSPLGPLPLEMPLILSPGEHRLVARAPGRRDAERSLRLASGDALLVELALPSLTDPGPKIGGGGVADTGGPAGGTGAGGLRGTAPGAAPRAPRRFAVNAGFGTNALRVSETGLPTLGLALALGSRLELGVDATLVAYAVVPSVRVRIAGEAIALHAIAAAPIAFTDGGEAKTFAAAAVGLGLRLRLPAMPALALRLESYAAFAGDTHGTSVPTYLGGELWF